MLIKRQKIAENEQKLLTNLAYIEKAFLPSARSFNNCFDQIDFEKSKKGIIAEAIVLLK